MGILDHVERGLEKAVRGAFSRKSKTQQVHPVEIANKIRRELDDKAMTLTTGRTLTPNVFDVHLSEPDFTRAKSWGSALAEELCDITIEHARSQGYSLQGPVKVSFTKNAELPPGVFQVISSTVRDHASSASSLIRPMAHPKEPQRFVLDVIDGGRYSLTTTSTVLGRSSGADIVLEDHGISRRHLEIRTAPPRPLAVDLGSTNGSFLDGQRFTGRVPLRDGSRLTIGNTRMIFRLFRSDDERGRP